MKKSTLINLCAEFLEAHSDVKKICHNAALDAKSSGEIGVLISGALEYGYSNTELADYFHVSKPTIDRWARGVTAPHPYARPSIAAALMTLINQNPKP